MLRTAYKREHLGIAAAVHHRMCQQSSERLLPVIRVATHRAESNSKYQFTVTRRPRGLGTTAEPEPLSAGVNVTRHLPSPVTPTRAD